MKNLFILISFLLIVNIADAQYRGRYQWYVTAGVGGGAIISHMDIVENNIHPGAAFYFNFHSSYTFMAGLEVQSGLINAGKDKYNRQSKNQFIATFLKANVKLFPDADFIQTILPNLYLGSGVGFIKNNVTDVLPDVSETSDPALAVGWRPTYSGTDVLIPFNAGIIINFKNGYRRDSNVSLNLNYQNNKSITDWLDGYSSIVGGGNLAKDSYSFVSLGLHYRLGR